MVKRLHSIEFIRKRLEIFIVKNPHLKQCQVVDHYVHEGITWQTIYNDLNICKNGQSISTMDIYYEGKIEETG